MNGDSHTIIINYYNTVVQTVDLLEISDFHPDVRAGKEKARRRLKRLVLSTLQPRRWRQCVSKPAEEEINSDVTARHGQQLDTEIDPRSKLFVVKLYFKKSYGHSAVSGSSRCPRCPHFVCAEGAGENTGR